MHATLTNPTNTRSIENSVADHSEYGGESRRHRRKNPTICIDSIAHHVLTRRTIRAPITK
jgi:hypothetical protein